MRKISSLLLIGCLLLGITGCSNPAKSPASSNLSPETLVSEFNKGKDDAFSDLKLTEGKDVTLDKQLEGVYRYKDPVSFLDQQFNLILLTSVSSEKKIIYAVDYEKVFSGSSAGKDAYDMAKSLMRKLTDKYGTPTTYPGLSNQLSSLSDYKSGSQEKYSEQWKVSDSADVYLNLMGLTNPSASLTIEYRTPQNK
jgi:hypothetical protein